MRSIKRLANYMKNRLLLIVTTFLLISIPVTVSVINNLRDSRGRAENNRQIPQLLETTVSRVLFSYIASSGEFKILDKTNLVSPLEPKVKTSKADKASFKVVLLDRSGKTLYETGAKLASTKRNQLFDLVLPSSQGSKIVISDWEGRVVFEESL